MYAAIRRYEIPDPDTVQELWKGALDPKIET